MKKQSIIGISLATLTTMSSGSYAMKTPPPTKPGSLSVSDLGIVRQYLPESTRHVFDQVNKKCVKSENEAGVADEYLELLGCINNGLRYKKITFGNNVLERGRLTILLQGESRYVVESIETLEEILKIIKGVHFKVFMVKTEKESEKETEKKSDLSSFIINGSSENIGLNFILAPCNYQISSRKKESMSPYEILLAEEHLKSLKQLELKEDILPEHPLIKRTLRAPRNIEDFFYVGFEISEEMYPDDWDEQRKNEFKHLLSNFYKRHIIQDFGKSYCEDDQGIYCNVKQPTYIDMLLHKDDLSYDDMESIRKCKHKLDFDGEETPHEYNEKVRGEYNYHEDISEYNYHEDVSDDNLQKSNPIIYRPFFKMVQWSDLYPKNIPENVIDRIQRGIYGYAHQYGDTRYFDREYRFSELAKPDSAIYISHDLFKGILEKFLLELSSKEASEFFHNLAAHVRKAVNAYRSGLFWSVGPGYELQMRLEKIYLNHFGEDNILSNVLKNLLYLIEFTGMHRAEDYKSKAMIKEFVARVKNGDLPVLEQNKPEDARKILEMINRIEPNADELDERKLDERKRNILSELADDEYKLQLDLKQGREEVANSVCKILDQCLRYCANIPDDVINMIRFSFWNFCNKDNFSYEAYEKGIYLFPELIKPESAIYLHHNLFKLALHLVSLNLRGDDFSVFISSLVSHTFNAICVYRSGLFWADSGIDEAAFECDLKKDAFKVKPFCGYLQCFGEDNILSNALKNLLYLIEFTEMHKRKYPDVGVDYVEIAKFIFRVKNGDLPVLEKNKQEDAREISEMISKIEEEMDPDIHEFYNADEIDK